MVNYETNIDASCFVSHCYGTHILFWCCHAALIAVSRTCHNGQCNPCIWYIVLVSKGYSWHSIKHQKGKIIMSISLPGVTSIQSHHELCTHSLLSAGDSEFIWDPVLCYQYGWTNVDDLWTYMSLHFSAVMERRENWFKQSIATIAICCHDFHFHV